MVLPGSITQRHTHCGRRNCGCHADLPRLHGPYWQWTRKIAAKTICRWLTPDQNRDYQAWCAVLFRTSLTAPEDGVPARQPGRQRHNLPPRHHPRRRP